MVPPQNTVSVIVPAALDVLPTAASVELRTVSIFNLAKK